MVSEIINVNSSLLLHKCPKFCLGIILYLGSCPDGTSVKMMQIHGPTAVNFSSQDFQHLSRGDLIDLCAAMQKNLRTAKSAFSEERSAVKALRKELQHERVSRSASLQGRYLIP